MTFTTAIFTILIALPPHISDADELPSARDTRLWGTATHIADASGGDRAKAAALIVLGDFEAHFARWVQMGCKGEPPKGAGTCDEKRSRSVWQMRPRACPSGWSKPRGSVEAQREFARCAAKHWSWNLRRCGSLAGAYSGYWKTCEGLPDADKRAAMHRRVEAMLWKGRE